MPAWVMTPDPFYFGYQPWISPIYLVIFISPILAAPCGPANIRTHVSLRGRP
jgi:hypothetical protein